MDPSGGQQSQDFQGCGFRRWSNWALQLGKQHVPISRTRRLEFQSIGLTGSFQKIVNTEGEKELVLLELFLMQLCIIWHTSSIVDELHKAFWQERVRKAVAAKKAYTCIQKERRSDDSSDESDSKDLNVLM
ncbi:hypothetical protein C5167_040942 [Papaver somniferum]|uniref:Uncharacterized protein n=1 Tax=Papaver somniferum TaxID=3469 RepID=A0A4Y7IIV4_PAPSO|nr:hypothetical protein C5167_040942 [Papaver somniferum]